MSAVLKKQPIDYWIQNKNLLQNEYNAREISFNRLLGVLIDDMESKTEGSAQNVMIKGRVKKFENFYRKLLEKSRKQSINSPFDDIFDILGLRIIVPFLEDIERVGSRISETCSIIETKHKSHDLSIHEFGYDSLHFIMQIPKELRDIVNISDNLNCEVQIRTILQNAWAEVEHELVYKTSINKVEDTIRRKLIALNATLSLADINFQEIRDYQRRRIQDIEERHSKILDKVSTVPQKMGNRYFDNPGTSQTSQIQVYPTNIKKDLSSAEVNDLFYEALNAHINNNLDKAIELYSLLIAISPSHYLYNHRGLVHFSLSQYDKALNDFNVAIEIQPKDTRVYTNRGLTYRMLKEETKALDDFNKSLELNPLWADTFYGRSLTYYDMGDIRSALEDCDKAIALKPDFKQAVRFKQFILNQDMK